jgi:hypothetical protein
MAHTGGIHGSRRGRKRFVIYSSGRGDSLWGATDGTSANRYDRVQIS